MESQKLKLLNNVTLWSTNKRYKVGDLVSYSGVFYQNITGINSIPTDVTNWKSLTVSALSLINTTTGNDTDQFIKVKNSGDGGTEINNQGLESTELPTSRFSKLVKLTTNEGLVLKTSDTLRDFTTVYRNDNITFSAVFQAPNTSTGTFTQPISVDGVFAGLDGNIVTGKIRKAVFQIDQSGTSAPTLTVIYNNSGETFTATRISLGIYRITPSISTSGQALMQVQSQYPNAAGAGSYPVFNAPSAGPFGFFINCRNSSTGALTDMSTFGSILLTAIYEFYD